MGVMASRQLEARRRALARRIERAVRDADRRSPEAARKRTLIDAATRSGRRAVNARQQAEGRLVDALRRLVSAGFSVRESADRLGVTYYEARALIRAAEVADADRPSEGEQRGGRQRIR